MSEEERFKLENELLMTKSKAQMINLYLDKLEELQQKENIIKEVREYIMSELITEWDIKNNGYVSGSDLPADAITPILQILDKENKYKRT